MLIDERIGSKEAIRLELSITGSITGLLGILLVAKRRELVTAIKSIMDELIAQASFRVSDRFCAEVLAAAGENIQEVID